MTANSILVTDHVSVNHIIEDNDNEVEDKTDGCDDEKNIAEEEEEEDENDPCHGLQVHDNFITEDEATELLEYLSHSLKNDDEWQQEGFQRRRRTLKICLEDLPSSMMRPHNKERCQYLWRKMRKEIQQIIILSQDQNENNTNDDENSIQISVEERYTLSQSCTSNHTKKDLNDTLASVSLFESSHEQMRQCEEENKTNDCFVAYMALQNPCLQILTVPKNQKQSHDYHVKTSWKVLQKPQTLIIKQQDSLWSCKYRIGNYHPLSLKSQQQQFLINQPQIQRQIFLIKFTNLCEIDDDNYCKDAHMDKKPTELKQNQDGVVSMDEKDKDLSSQKMTLPPLSQLLTIIVTTSPIKSNPSTDILEGCFDTFSLAGEDFAYECNKVIVCDGCRISSNTTSRKHANVKQALRNGLASKTQAENYEKYKIALKQLCVDAEASLSNSTKKNRSPFLRTKVVELSERHGYGFALRHALRYEVHTPYVCVIQHDRTFMRPTPIQEVVHTMYQQSNIIKYVGMNMRSNLLYRDAFISKYGKVAFEQLLQMVRYPPLLRFDANLYGPNAKLETILQDTPILTMDDHKSEKVKKNLLSMQRNYRKSRQNMTHNPPPFSEQQQQTSLAQCSLTPTLFWYDNIHVCETSHYRDYIFCDKFKMVARGGFVEDKTSPVITKNVERFGLQKGHAKFGSYLLDDHSGMFFTGHLDGGSYLTSQGRKEQKLQNLQSSNNEETGDNTLKNKGEEKKIDP